MKLVKIHDIGPAKSYEDNLNKMFNYLCCCEDGYIFVSKIFGPQYDGKFYFDDNFSCYHFDDMNEVYRIERDIFDV